MEFNCQSNREIELWPAKDETFIFSRSAPLTALSSRRTITPCNKRKIDTECIFDRCIRCLYFTTIREIVQNKALNLIVGNAVSENFIVSDIVLVYPTAIT